MDSTEAPSVKKPSLMRFSPRAAISRAISRSSYSGWYWVAQ